MTTNDKPVLAYAGQAIILGYDLLVRAYIIFLSAVRLASIRRLPY